MRSTPGDAVLRRVLGAVALLPIACGPTPPPEPSPGAPSQRPTGDQPSAATLRAARSLTDVLDVGLFADPQATGQAAAFAYFDALARDVETVRLTRVQPGDRDAAALRRFAHRAGGVVLLHGHRRRVVPFAAFDEGRGDAQIQRALSELARPDVTVVAVGDVDAERAQQLARAAASRGATVTFLGPNAPLGTGDVVVAIHRVAVPPARVETLTDHLAGGGKLLLAFEPEAAPSLAPVLAALGLESAASVHIPDAPSSPGDDGPPPVHTDRLGSHRSVANLANLRGALDLAFVDPGGLRPSASAPPDAHRDVVVRAPAAARIVDDGPPHGGAAREVPPDFGWVMAVELDATRAIVIADADAVLDAVIAQSPSNRLLLRDALQWLAP